MYSPVKEEENIPFFSSLDIEQYGMPELYGYHTYRVIESRETEMVLDFVQCQQYGVEDPTTPVRKNRSTRPVHHYNRMDRFNSSMTNLLGYGNVPEHVTEIVLEELVIHEKEDIWESIEVILKKHKLQKYVDRIPTILRILGYEFMTTPVSTSKVESTFQMMSEKFDLKQTDRKYFPKMRYVCLRLLIEQGAFFGYNIPLIKTNCKIKPISDVYNILRN